MAIHRPVFFLGSSDGAVAGRSTTVGAPSTDTRDTVVGAALSLPMTTVAPASGAEVMPRIGRQPAIDCGRSRAATARPASTPASRPGAKPAGATFVNGS